MLFRSESDQSRYRFLWRRILIVCGEKDRANRGASEMMAEKIHGARIKILEGCGHEVNVEAPEKLAEILEAFYEEK